jgi:hypothetical protein
MNKNERAKLEFKAFHEKADKRILFLLQLYKDGHDNEALTHCLSYIDSFSQWLFWPSSKTGENFADALINFRGDPIIGLIQIV